MPGLPGGAYPGQVLFPQLQDVGGTVVGSTTTTRGIDIFQRANGAIGAGWTTLSGTIAGSALAGFSISNFQAFGASGSLINATAYTAYGPLPVDMWALFVMGALNDDGGVMVRSNLVDTAYVLDVSVGTGEFNIYKIVAGTVTQIDQVMGLTILSGDVCYLEVQGTQIRTAQNGVLRNNFTDASIDGVSVGGKFPGMFNGSNTMGYVRFEMGDFRTVLRRFDAHRPAPFKPGNPNYPRRF